MDVKAFNEFLNRHVVNLIAFKIRFKKSEMIFYIQRAKW